MIKEPATIRPCHPFRKHHYLLLVEQTRLFCQIFIPVFRLFLCVGDRRCSINPSILSLGGKTLKNAFLLTRSRGDEPHPSHTIFIPTFSLFIFIMASPMHRMVVKLNGMNGTEKKNRPINADSFHVQEN